MSVVVQGMDMPAKCCGCDAEQHDESFYGDEFNHVCSFIYKGYTGDIRDRRRLNDCSLRPLPEKHGRLIDENWLKKTMITTLEALRKNPKMDGQEMHLIAAFGTLRAMIDDAPTIVEAEGDD